MESKTFLHKRGLVFHRFRQYPSNPVPENLPPPDPQLAFTRHFVANQAALYGFLVSLVQDLHAADDLLQELAGRLWVKFETNDSNRPFIAWGIGFARLIAMEWRREQQRLPLSLDESTLDQLAEQAAEQAGQLDERRDALHECLKSLTLHRRRVLHLRYQEELSVATIARTWKRTTLLFPALRSAPMALSGDCRIKQIPNSLCCHRGHPARISHDHRRDGQGQRRSENRHGILKSYRRRRLHHQVPRRHG